MVIALLFYYRDPSGILVFHFSCFNFHYLVRKILLIVFRHNFHTHTSYCDGSSSPEAYVKAALDAGLLSMGFSGHAPVPMENGFAIRDDKALKEYFSDIVSLREAYRKDIAIYLGLEVDYIPGITRPFGSFRENWPLDYIIGSVHLVRNPENKLWFIDGPDRSLWIDGLVIDYKGDVKKAVGDYYHQLCEMVEQQRPDIVGHLDKVKMHNHGAYFSEDEPWYKDLVMACLHSVLKTGCIVEVNTRGIYKKRSESLFPAPWILKEMKQMGIAVTISSDAHKPEEIAMLLDVGSSALQAAGYSEAYVFTSNGWQAEAL